MKKFLVALIMLPLLIGMAVPASAAATIEHNVWTWYQTSTGINPFPDGIKSIVFSPNDLTHQTVFAGTSNGVYKSIDGGFNWTEAGMNDGTHVNALAFFPIVRAGSKHSLFAGTALGVFRTADEGATWVDISENLATDATTVISTIAFAPNNTLFAGTNGYGMFKTTNPSASPVTWSEAGSTSTLNTDHTDVTSLVFSPDYNIDHLLFAGSDNGDIAGGIYTSSDSGDSWVETDTNLPDLAAHRFVASLAISPNFLQDHTLFAGIGGSQGVYKSTDAGITWSFLTDTASLGIQALAISPNYAQDGTLFAGEDGGGIYMTTNGGASWKPINDGFSPSDSITALAIQPTQTSQPFNMFAGTHADGVWQMVYQTTVVF